MTAGIAHGCRSPRQAAHARWIPVNPVSRQNHRFFVTYLDLSLSYEFASGFHARLGVNNLTGTDAPLMPGLENNTDALLYDVFGRSYFLSLFVRVFE